MIAFLGPAQAVVISPFCTLEDISAWSQAQRVTRSVLDADAVWRQLLISHFNAAFTCLGATKESPPAVERLAADLPEQALRQVYVAMRNSLSCSPFVLQPRARLVLEIHELREWDRHRKRFEMNQQALRLASTFADNEAMERLRLQMTPLALELVSLQAMMGDARAARSIQLPQIRDVRWGESAETDLRILVERRLQHRKAWWQKQRDYLIQDLEMR